MKKLMGLVASIALLTGMLVGCAGTSAQNNTSIPESASSTTEAITSPKTETSAPQTSENVEAVFPLAYTDARGKEVMIEQKPKRIAATTWMITEKLLALDDPPVAADTIETMTSWDSMKKYLEKYHVEDLGTEVNLEKLLEVKPDLILATQANEKIYDQLEAIAPVVVFDSGLMFGDWQVSTREVAKVVGEEAAAEVFVSDLKARIVKAREKISINGKSVAFLRLWSKTIYSMGIDTCAAYYDGADGLGLTIPRGYPQEIGELSLESLTELNPDYIFISTSEDEAYMGELGKNSVWNALTAVKEGHIYPMGLSGLAGGPLAAKYGIQVILDALAK